MCEQGRHACPDRQEVRAAHPAPTPTAPAAENWLGKPPLWSPGFLYSPELGGAALALLGPVPTFSLRLRRNQRKLEALLK